MPECPRCHQAVETKAIACPYCQMPLKAYGHPGMTLHYATGEEPLCLTCAYHEDDSCTLPKRPHARDCTLYRDRRQSMIAIQPGYRPGFALSGWVKRHVGLLALLGLVLLSLLLVLVR